jgi:hypothetical protein
MGMAVKAPVSRRAFLGGVFGGVALVGPLASGAGAASTNTVYWLNPSWGDGDPGCVPNVGQSTCGGCYACVSHYQNKVFASAAAADAHRAHPRCKCKVEAAFTVDDETYAALFGSSDSADRRTPGVAEILAGSTIAPAPAATGVSADAGSGGLALTGAPVLALAAAGAGAAAAGVVMLRSSRERPAES